eukprot:TRINITY_DN7881_c0_g1_i1.p1 TRINITY_DN7881_c0_g1~~TRINITY_DN7881_c0_g1_i1.p1  ORF type:complete len:189 (+),score=31.70 TRINITY_DN7881_c0_g1_i1:22-567(+)
MQMLTNASDSSDDEFVPPPCSVRIEAALTELEAPSKLLDMSGWWMLQQIPSPLETNRIAIELSRSGAGFRGTSEVAMAKDSTVMYSVEVVMEHIYGPAYTLSQKMITKPHPGNIHLRPKTWFGTSTVYADEAGNYFSGTYTSGFTSGVVTAARTTTSERSSDCKWPPRPPPKKVLSRRTSE